MPEILNSPVPLIVLLIIAVIAIISSLAKVLFAPKRKNPSFPYERKNPLFTPAERSFLGVLDQAVSPDYRVFGQVRMADVMSVSKGLDKSSRQQAFNKIQSKHFDFVICRASDLSISLVIELDDKSHSAPKRQERDKFMNSATQAAGIPLLRVPCQKSYSLQKLTELMAPHLKITEVTCTAAEKTNRQADPA